MSNCSLAGMGLAAVAVEGYQGGQPVREALVVSLQLSLVVSLVRTDQVFVLAKGV